MNKDLIFMNCIRFVIVIFFQVLVLNNLNIAGYVNPFFYVIFIIMLPSNTYPSIVVLSSFLLGLANDIFSQQVGLHAFTATLIGFLRTYLLNMILLDREPDVITCPSIRETHSWRFILFATLMVVLYHFVYFSIEIFNIREILDILIRTIASSIVTLILIFVTQIIFINKK